MALLTKPSIVARGQDNEFSVDKAELISLMTAQGASAHFLDSNNWKQAKLNYSSSIGQKRSVRLEVGETALTGLFSPSSSAETDFTIISIEVSDKDFASFTIQRENLPIQELDLVLDEDSGANSDEIKKLFETSLVSGQIYSNIADNESYFIARDAANRTRLHRQHGDTVEPLVVAYPAANDNVWNTQVIGDKFYFSINQKIYRRSALNTDEIEISSDWIITSSGFFEYNGRCFFIATSNIDDSIGLFAIMEDFSSYAPTPHVFTESFVSTPKASNNGYLYFQYINSPDVIRRVFMMSTESEVVDTVSGIDIEMGGQIESVYSHGDEHFLSASFYDSEMNSVVKLYRSFEGSIPTLVQTLDANPVFLGSRNSDTYVNMRVFSGDSIKSRICKITTGVVSDLAVFGTNEVHVKSNFMIKGATSIFLANVSGSPYSLHNLNLDTLALTSVNQVDGSLALSNNQGIVVEGSNRIFVNAYIQSIAKYRLAEYKDGNLVSVANPETVDPLCAILSNTIAFSGAEFVYMLTLGGANPRYICSLK